jgi:hypothetical protein
VRANVRKSTRTYDLQADSQWRLFSLFLPGCAAPLQHAVILHSLLGFWCKAAFDLRARAANISSSGDAALLAEMREGEE